MKTGNDLVAEQVRYSTCFCYLPNCANQRNFAALQRIAVLLPDSSIGRIDSFLSIYGFGICRLTEPASFANRKEQRGEAVYPQGKTEDGGGEPNTSASDSGADTFALH